MRWLCSWGPRWSYGAARSPVNCATAQQKERRTMSVMFVRSIWVIFQKDLRVWWRNPLNIVASLLPVLTILLINGLGTVAVGRAPVALVTLDHGPKGQEMQQIFHQAELYRIPDATPELAQAEHQNEEVSAVITI